MTPETANKLQNRNTKIIEILLKKINKCCPGSVDIIGIAGSFANDQYDERSDLDLCIITNNSNATTINKCFILEDIGFDLYCTPWEKMERMAEYKSPYVTKLLNLKIVYSSNKTAEDRYYSLRSNLQIKMKNTHDSLITAQSFFDKAFQAYAMLLLSDSNSECWFNFYKMAINIESGLFVLNGDYIKKGIKNVPSELAQLVSLPDDFINLYEVSFKSVTVTDLKSNATKLAQSIKNMLDITNKTPFEIITPQKLTATYEEVFSNWKNKVERAAETKDIYSQFMAMASCQNFYNEMNLADIDILTNFQVNDLKMNAKYFAQGMEEWAKLYQQTNTPIALYKNIEEFEDEYLK